MSGALEEAVAALGRGDLVLMPTETVYGLAADAGDPLAVARIFEAKGRPRFNPLIAHVASLDAAAALIDVPAQGRDLARAFWPGPLTLVGRAKAGGRVCELARAGLDSVAVRVPGHPLALALLETFARPVVAPSANRSGRPSPTRFADALEETGESVAVALDGGDCRVGLESTVVSLLDARPAILRAGGLTRAAIVEIVGELAPAASHGHRSPGRLALHYAPRAPVRLEADGPREGEAYLAFGAAAPDGAGVFNLSASGRLDEAAANLFAFLRAADRLVPRAIAVAPIPSGGLGEAINDRLRRAAGFVG